MDTKEIMRNYGWIGFAVLYMGWRYLRSARQKARVPEFLKQGAQIVDVRSPAEFQAAANPNSINIPLAELSRQAEKLDRNRPVVVCCASGGRSSVALAQLKSLGFSQVLNAGPWTNTLTEGRGLV